MPADGHSATGAMASLVQLAVSSDDSERLVAALAAEAGCPLGLAGATGEPLGHGPDDGRGLRALAVARAAARQQLVAPPGWHIARLEHASTVLGFLAIGGAPPDAGANGALVGLMPALVADQLKRTALTRAQRSAFERRLVTENSASAEQLRREAADIGLGVAAAYCPALLAWRHTVPPEAVVATVAAEARRRVAGAVAVPLERCMVLLHPEAEPDGATSADAWAWFAAVAGHARGLAPSSRAEAIADQRAVALDRLSRRIASLRADARFAPRSEDAQPVVSARQFALDRLLSESVGAAAGQEYVDDCVGRLVTWDREHRTSLLAVLEAALDYPRHEHAAEHCYMHRNTFRRRLRQALHILGDELEDPNVRLAVHVALKVRKLPLSRASAGGSDGRRDGAAARRGRTGPPGARRRPR
jgi:sugar diacid utilization regulator